MTRAREEEKKDDIMTIEQRRKISLESLKNEYENRKLLLENNKRDLMERYQNETDRKMELSRELLANDYKMEENEKFVKNEESNIPSNTSKRGYLDKDSMFIFEDWMNPILEYNIMLSNFDFKLACDYIRHELKSQSVKNTELLNDLDLRSKWTELESKILRKEDLYFNTCFDYDYEDNSVKMNKERLDDSEKEHENHESRDNENHEEKKVTTGKIDKTIIANQNNLNEKKEYFKKQEPEYNYSDYVKSNKEDMKNESEEEIFIDTKSKTNSANITNNSNNEMGNKVEKYYDELD